MNILDFVRIETSTVKDGNMSHTYGEKEEVNSNRRKFWMKNGFKYDNTYLLRTSFEKLDNVKVLNTLPNGFTVVQDVDSVLTNNRDVVLALLTADCLQITLYDSKHSVLGLIHAGFKWQDARIIDNTFKVMENEFDSEPKDVLIHLGNCISPEYYRWDSNIFKYIDKESWIGKTIEKDNHKEKPYRIDIRKAAILNLKDIGVRDENIIDSNVDCYSDRNYYSHVRSVYSNEPDSRHITLVQMK
ncbi:MAG: Putative cytoplasmic protein [candidate division WS6 bacterium 34_10]|uniref:Putative cytoplasmic protein n=1 Tax=candidate division WS6 bacterium 34_10 TaxID=1641389 RepID=A0A117LZT7_9BACT|nr:MAG: Putative cytoplasmic protein [candidate division WS6 bacterium 34_10]